LKQPKSERVHHSAPRPRQRLRPVAGAMTLLIASVLSVGAFSLPASAQTCYAYLIDCTSPLSAQSGSSRPCDYYAITAVAATTQSSGPAFVSVQLRYSGGGASATCGSAWSKIANFSCPGTYGCAYPYNAFAFAQRLQPNFLSTNNLADIPGTNGNDVSKQVKDCCGGFLAVAGGQLYGTGGSTIVSSYTSSY
jgi:hypothetical protein